MSWKYALCAVVLLFQAFIALGAEGLAEKKEINAAQLNQDVKIIGKLGHPLGRIVQISCQVVHSDDHGPKRLADKLLLEVFDVDGKQLEAPVKLEYDSLSNNMDLKAGDTLNCIGFETGSFKGLPKNSFDYTMPVSSTQFCFSTEFFILKTVQASGK